MIRSLRLAFVILCCALVSSMAAPPSEQSVNEMITVMQLQALLDQALKGMNDGMTKGMEQGLKKSLEGKELSDAQKGAVADFRAKFAATMKEELSFAKVREIYLQSYRETFTQDEVDAIIAFYKSPAGKAILEKNPAAMQKAGSLMEARISPMSLKLQTMLEDFIKSLATTK